MAGEWCETTLGSVVELKRGYDLPQREREPGHVPIVSSSGITDYHSVARVSAPGVVTGRYGTLGQVYYLVEDFWPLNTTLYVTDFKGNDPRFVSYLLRSLDYRPYSDKAAVPGVNRNHLHLAPVRVPRDVGEQRAIAHILGTLDDKIENNRRISATLEAMARALYKAWFVDFEPVRAKMAGHPSASAPGDLTDLFPDRLVPSELGDIPEGWRAAALDDIATFLNGLAMQKFPADGGDTLPVIKIAQLRAGSTAGADRANLSIPSDYIVHDGDILFSWSGSLECVLWAGGTGALNQHLFKVTSVRYPEWLAYLGVQQHLEEFRSVAAGKATTMGHIQRGNLSDAMISLASDGLLESATKVIEPVLQESWKTRVECRTLGELRDALLPGLVSGALQVGAVA